MRGITRLFSAFATASLLSANGAVLGAQQTHDHQAEQPSTPKAQDEKAGQPMKCCQQMATTSVDLSTLVEKMKAAEGQAKIEAMEAVIAALVEQATEHRSQMMKMMEHGSSMKSGGSPATTAPKH